MGARGRRPLSPAGSRRQHQSDGGQSSRPSAGPGTLPSPPDTTPILGLEMAGVISEVGADVEGWSVGDRVMSLLGGGGYAERVAVDAGMLMRLPDSWSFELGAAVPEAWLTAFSNLFLEGQLHSGQTVLIHAGASGVGTAAIQLASSIGARVIATAGTDAKTEFCRELGAEIAVNYKTDDFLSLIMAETDGVDLILDPVGSDYLERNLKLLKENGQLIVIGLLGGSVSKINLGQILSRSLRIAGTRLRPLSIPEKIRIIREFDKMFRSQFESGSLRPIIDRTFTIESAGEAHRYVKRNLNAGKVILTVSTK
jgi:tumor protein p53-inducible protein 3